MSAKHASFGKGGSFLETSFSCDESLFASVQPIVLKGYQFCTRRIYGLRISNRKMSDEEALDAFRQSGLLAQLSSAKKSVAQRLADIRSFAQESQAEGADVNGFTSVDIAFAFSGLKKMRVKAELLEVFRRKSPAYYDNALIRAHSHLGDTGLSDPTNWLPLYQKPSEQTGFDIALIVHFASESTAKPKQNDALITQFEKKMVEIFLGAAQTASVSQSSATPLNADWIETAAPLDDWHSVYFGYRDGITKPKYSNNAPEHDDNGWRDTHELGEILLGFPNNDKENRYGDLNLVKKANSHTDPSKVPHETKWQGFFKGSSFGVMRKIMQRTDYFEQEVSKLAKRSFMQDAATGVALIPQDPYATSKKWIRSKMLGRTPEGVMLVPSMSIQDAADALPNFSSDDLYLAIGKEKGFHRTQHDDSQCEGCPFSSHIRRMNPRDDPVVPFVHRPLLRRSMPYTNDRVYMEEKDVGLSGLFLCADITEQFEHLVGKWANDRVMGIPDSSGCKDPLIGNHESADNLFQLDSKENSTQMPAIGFDQPFVITRGCAYVWFPTVAVLETLDKNYIVKAS